MTEPTPILEPRREASLLEMIAAIVGLSAKGRIEWELLKEEAKK